MYGVWVGYGLRWIHLRRGGPFSPLGIRISLISTSGFRTPPTVRSGAFRSIRHPYAYRAYIKRMSSLFVLRYTVDAKSHNEYKNVTHKMIASPCIFKSECITLGIGGYDKCIVDRISAIGSFYFSINKLGFTTNSNDLAHSCSRS